MKVLCRSVWLCDPLDCSLPGSSMGFSRQGYWSGVPFPSCQISRTQGLNLDLLHCRQMLYRLYTWKSYINATWIKSLELLWVKEKYEILRTNCVVLYSQVFMIWSEMKWSEKLFATPWNSPWNSPGQNTGVGSLSFSRGSSQPRDWTQVSCTVGVLFTIWAMRDALMTWRLLQNIRHLASRYLH